mgnify:CR=1 FL=1
MISSLKKLAALAVAMTMTAIPAVAADSIAGTWYTDGKRAVVKIGKCGDTVCGKISRFIEKPKDGVTTDINNPDPELRKRPLLGLAVLSGFTLDGDIWRGEIYNPETGKSYRSVVERTGKDKLKVQGCISLFCRTQRWTLVR